MVTTYWFTTQFPYVRQGEGLWVRPRYLNTIKEMNRSDKVAIYEASSDPHDNSKRGKSAVVALAQVEDIYEPPIREEQGEDVWLKIASLHGEAAKRECPLKETLLILKPGKKAEIESANNLGSYIMGYGGRMTKIEHEQFEQFRVYCRISK